MKNLRNHREIENLDRPRATLIRATLVRISLFLAAASAIGLSGAACTASPSKAASSNTGAGAAAVAEPAPVNVRVARLQFQELEETFSLVGQTYAEDAVTLSAETVGRVETLRVDVGDRVRRGQLLARVDFRSLRAQVDQAEAEHVLAHKVLARLEHLKSKQAVAQQAVDEAVARDHLAEASLRLAEAQLSKSVIRSPMAGQVVARHVRAGEYVNPGQPILAITDLSSVKVRAQAPAKLLTRLRPGQPVHVRLPALKTALKGRVELVVPVASKASRTFEIRVALDQAPRPVPVGLDSRLTIVAEVHDRALVIPQPVVLEHQSGQHVFVAKEGKAMRRPVELGPVVGQRVLVQEGLNEGDLLIVDGHRYLVDGQSITLVD